jgi:hypothetical protein
VLDISVLCQTLSAKSNAMEAQWAAQPGGDQFGKHDQHGDKEAPREADVDDDYGLFD